MTSEEKRDGRPDAPGNDLQSTLDLLLRARSGDERAKNIFAERYIPRLARWASGRLPSHLRGPHATSDMVQDALIAFLGKLDTIDLAHQRAPFAYLRRTILNRIRDFHDSFHSRGEHVAVDEIELASDRTPYEDLVNKRVREAYEAALEKLSDEAREAVVQRIEYGLPFAEIAALLGKSSADSARMLVARSIAQLVKEMKNVR